MSLKIFKCSACGLSMHLGATCDEDKPHFCSRKACKLKRGVL